MIVEYFYVKFGEPYPATAVGVGKYVCLHLECLFKII